MDKEQKWWHLVDCVVCVHFINKVQHTYTRNYYKDFIACTIVIKNSRLYSIKITIKMLYVCVYVACRIKMYYYGVYNFHKMGCRFKIPHI